MDVHKKPRFIVLALCFMSWTLVVSAVDRTREDRAVGADIVQAVVDIIRENCIYPNDRIFLRRLAYVESKDGRNTDTFRPNFYGGIWQVEKSEFESTKHCYGIEDMCRLIQEKLHIDWRSVRWHDLTKPLYSGLAASLKLQQIAGNNTPGVLERQAEFWVNNYNKGKYPYQFISEVQKIPQEKCQIDLAFILDGSGSITFINFLKILDFVKNVTKQLEIGPSAVEVATVSFSDYARVEFGFGAFNTQNAVNVAIDRIKYDAGGTNTASGIRTARLGVFQHNSRPNAVKVGLVITDGYSNSLDSTVLEAMYAKNDGITLFAIGIGDVNEHELHEVASRPNCTHVFLIAQFSEIDSLVYEIMKAACRAPVAINVPTPTQSPPSTDIFGSTSTTPPPVNTTITGVITNSSATLIGALNSSTTMNLSVKCGIVHVYVSYDNPHPSPVLYSDKVTATDGHPAILYINQTVAGRPVYLAFVGTQLPQEAAGLKNCSDSKYTATFTEGNTGGHVEIICRENNVERECTKVDFTLSEKYKEFICSSTGGVNTMTITNPCTATAIQSNQMYFPHPYDDTKFIKCDYQQKMYITQCPNGERYHQGSHSCGSTTATISGDKTPLDHDVTNPCSAQALMNHQLFFAYSKDKTKFIHCDVWGHAWVLNCPSSLIWNQQTQTCIEDTHSSSNPCTQAMLDQGITMFPIKDPHKYIHCDNGLNPWVQSCVGGTVFSYASQNCVWDSASGLG